MEYHALAAIVMNNLREQHHWDFLELIPETGDGPNSVSGKPRVPRPLVRGLPPRLLYLHPDDQKAALAVDGRAGPPELPCVEWVLPLHIAESCSVRGFASVFDAITPPSPSPSLSGLVKNNNKRILLAIVHPDSSVVYYIMHDGMVKPRQN